MSNPTASANSPAVSAPGSFRARVVLAFFAIYILWGTTFLAIRIAVEELPPLFAAAARFFIAGVLLYGAVRLKGEAAPSRRQWGNLARLALLLFVAEYGPLFWAERYVSSGVASVLAATITILIMLAEVFLLRQQRLSWATLAAAATGFLGVAVLVLQGGSGSAAMLPSLLLIAGCASWACGSVMARSLDLPASRSVASGAMMMLGGAGLFALAALFGELHPLPHLTLRAALAEGYLIVFGSLMGFTAYMWLLGQMPAGRVASYAYVNPVVAVALGYLLMGERVTVRTLAGSALVLVSVFLILRPPRRQDKARRLRDRQAAGG